MNDAGSIVPIGFSTPGQVFNSSGPDAFGAWFGGTRFEGEDAGLTDEFTRLDGWLPLWQAPDSVLFLTGGLTKYDDASELFGGSLAMGYRSWDPLRDIVFGAYTAFDYRESRFAGYSQLVGGLELWWHDWELRLNGYLALDDDQTLAGVSALQYTGINLLANAVYETPLSGYDLDAGHVLFRHPSGFELVPAVGIYGLTGDAVSSTTGVRGRLEARYSEWLYVTGAVQNDSLFDTTASLTMTFLLGPEPARGSAVYNNRRRLDDPLRRQSFVQIAQSQRQETVINPADGQPLVFRHYDSSAPGGGDGSFEAPLNTLSNPPAGVDIALLHAGSVFTGQAITAGTDGQRILGDSATVPHTTTSQFGVIPLPRANMLTAAPTIDMSPGGGGGGAGSVAGPGAVNIAANNVEVSGLNITNPQGDGIFGNNITGFNINRNTIDGSLDDGVDLDGTVSGLIVGNTVTNGTGVGLEDGFEIDTFTGGLISGNTADGNRGDGFLILSLTGGQIIGNRADNSGLTGFNIISMSGGEISGNTATGNAANGFRFVSSISGGQVTNNTATGNGQAAFLLNNGLSGGLFSGNTASGHTSVGFTIIGAGLTGGEFSNNTSTGNLAGFAAGPITGGLFTGNTATGNTLLGFQLSTINGTGLINGNTAEMNGGDGFQFFDTLDTGTFTNNVSNNNGGQGYTGTTDPNPGTARNVNNNTGTGNTGGGDTFNGP